MPSAPTRFSDEIHDLTDEVARREVALETIRDFEKKGGKFRLALTVDHPDAKVRSIVEGVAQSHLPAAQIIAALVQWAEKDLKAAKEAVATRVLTESIREDAGEVTA